MSETQHQLSLTRSPLNTCRRTEGNFYQCLNRCGYIRRSIIGLCASIALGCNGSSGSGVGLSAMLAPSPIGGSGSVTGKFKMP
jgi:hypothetical protein